MTPAQRLAGQADLKEVLRVGEANQVALIQCWRIDYADFSHMDLLDVQPA